MPAKSKAQRRFFGMLSHNPKMAKAHDIHMSEEDMSDFASTPEKNLPEHASRDKKKKKGFRFPSDKRS